MHHCLQLWAFTCYHAPLCIIIMSQDTVLDQRQILGHISGYFLILYAFRKVRTQLVRLRNWTMLNPTCFFFSAWRLWCSSSWHAGELKTCRVESEPLTLRKYQAKLCQAQLESFSQYLRSIQKPLGKSRYQKTAKEVGPIITSNNNMSYAFICYDINYIYIICIIVSIDSTAMAKSKALPNSQSCQSPSDPPWSTLLQGPGPQVTQLRKVFSRPN